MWGRWSGDNDRERWTLLLNIMSTQITFVQFCQCSDVRDVSVDVLAGKRVSRDNLFRQTQLPPQRSDLIFMEIFQRFDYFSLEEHKQVESALQQTGIYSGAA